jgi:predicted nucleic acid-binding protein
MNVEFIDTNVLVYAADMGMGLKFSMALELISRLANTGAGAISTQVLAEFYNVATRKLRMRSEEAEETIRDLGTWTVHRPAHSDLLSAIRIQRRYKLGWWDSMIVNSAIQSGAKVLWSEDLKHGQKFGVLTVRNPFLHE